MFLVLNCNNNVSNINNCLDYQLFRCNMFYISLSTHKIVLKFRLCVCQNKNKQLELYTNVFFIFFVVHYFVIN